MKDLFICELCHIAVLMDEGDVCTCDTVPIPHPAGWGARWISSNVEPMPHMALLCTQCFLVTKMVDQHLGGDNNADAN